MRLLWEENVLGVIGAIIVTAFALVTAWAMLEGVMQLPGFLSMPLAALTAVGVLEAISRRCYAEAESPSPVKARERSARPV